MPFEPAPKTEEQQRVQTGRIALEAIAAHILTVPPERINMNLWCGTAQCAIGNSIHLPEVVATGLRLRPLSESERAISRQSHTPVLGELMEHAAIGEAFCIEPEVSRQLFGGLLHTGEAVAHSIRCYLRASA